MVGDYMAVGAGRFLGSPIFIYDENNNLITSTTVTGHSRGEMYIEVSEGLGNVKPKKDRLQLLILHPGGASELSGFVSLVRQGVYEIAIFGERAREARVSKRYNINASAVISDMATESDPDALIAPLPVTVENISATGVLIKSKDTRIEIGALVQVEFEMSGKEITLYGEIVREEVVGSNVYEYEYKYGCQLHFQ